MSIGITATTNIKDISSTQNTLNSLASQYEAEISNSDNYSVLTFCTMGTIHVYFETKNKKTTMIIEANTSLVGAGFHHCVVSFIDDFTMRSNISLDVEDDTEYFEHRNFEQMQENHFRWLKNLIFIVAKKKSEEPELSRLCLCWSLDQYTPNDLSGAIVTPFGRFNIETLLDRINEEGITSFANIFFIWNNKEKDAVFYRNSALQIMWENLRFIPISYSELEEKANNKVIEYLEKSATLDSALPFPKKEYLEICELGKHTPIDVAKLTEYNTDYPIGYRRNNVSHTFGGLIFTFSGSFFYQNDFDNGDYLDSDDGSFHVYNMDENWRNIRCSEITVEMVDGKKLSFSDSGFKNSVDMPTTIVIGDGECRYAFMGEYQDEDEPYYQTRGQVIVASSVFIITISYLQKSDKDWAEKIIKNIIVNNNSGEPEICEKTTEY